MKTQFYTHKEREANQIHHISLRIHPTLTDPCLESYGDIVQRHIAVHEARENKYI